MRATMASAPNLALFVCLTLVAAVGTINSAPAQEPAAAGTAPGLEYVTRIIGLDEEPELADILERSSRLIRLQDRPPATAAGLSRRAESDLDTFAGVLRSEGFYRFEVTYRIDAEQSPAEVSIAVGTGPVYLLADYRIAYEPATPELPDNLTSLGLEIGMRARSQPITEGQERLLRQLAETGFPFAKVLDRKATVDHQDTTMTIDLRVDPGPFTRFGDVTISPFERLDPAFVRRRVPWSRGDIYDRRKIEAFRKDMLSSGLFASARINVAAEPAIDGTRPIAIELRESKFRSVGVGASFSSSEGLAGTAFWEHRSLFGRGERFRLSATLGEIEQKGETTFRVPGFLRLDQDFVSSAEIGRDDTDAFESLGVKGQAGIERRFGASWRGFTGLSVDLSQIDDQDDTSNSLLFGLPLTVTRDTTDNPLDATTGTRLTLSTTPLAGHNDGAVAFLANEAGAAGFLPIGDRIVLAGRGRLGSIFGEDTAKIPADRRFFAGGGGSVRGYELQSVGPHDAQGAPIGGRSVYELGLELRVRLTDTIGIVPFLEGGQVFDDSLPDFSEAPLWSAGLGLRYFTAVGPIRFDIATPLNGRSTDDDFQFYISFGQAF